MSFFSVRKLFPRARLMANTRILIFENELLIQISFPTLNDGLDINDKLLG